MSAADELNAAQDEREARLRGEIQDVLLGDPWGGKPGTNFTQVSPAARKRLKGLMDHYRKKAHPFRACVRDNRKRFGPDAERVCAVLKDLIENRTTWRKGGKKKKLAELSEMTFAEFDQEVFALLQSWDMADLDRLANEMESE